MFWRDGDAIDYSMGASDRDYCVLRFTAQIDRHHCNFSSEGFGVGSVLVKLATQNFTPLGGEQYAANQFRKIFSNNVAEDCLC
jgi:hypothetical protein